MNFIYNPLFQNFPPKEIEEKCLKYNALSINFTHIITDKLLTELSGIMYTVKGFLT